MFQRIGNRRNNRLSQILVISRSV